MGHQRLRVELRRERSGIGPLRKKNTVLSGCFSDFNLESKGADLGADKPLECWKDQEALVKALPKFVEKACDLQLDLILCAKPLLRSEAEIQLDRCISNCCKD